MKYVLMFSLVLLSLAAAAQKQVKLMAEDDTEITADLYEAGPDAPVILLCHQAKSSRGEYINIAPRLMSMGYTCLAIDQRSGDTKNGVQNETHVFATKRKQPTQFIYSEQDIVAGIDYLAEKYGKKVIVLGSSYSASQALMIATYNDHMKAIMAFSPGEYFEDLSVATIVQYLTLPVFATGANSEITEVKAMLDGLDSEYLTVYDPKVEGRHGASVLDPKQSEDSEDYWKALTAFLEKL